MEIEMIVRNKVKIDAVRIIVPVNYGEEDIPNDFPGREGDVLTLVIDLDTRKVRGWPSHPGVTHLFMKVRDEGTYELLDRENVVYIMSDCYVPEFIPNEYGDYITLDIGADGLVENLHADTLQRQVQQAVINAEM